VDRRTEQTDTQSSVPSLASGVDSHLRAQEGRVHRRMCFGVGAGSLAAASAFSEVRLLPRGSASSAQVPPLLWPSLFSRRWKESRFPPRQSVYQLPWCSLPTAPDPASEYPRSPTPNPSSGSQPCSMANSRPWPVSGRKGALTTMPWRLLPAPEQVMTAEPDFQPSHLSCPSKRGPLP
jgi:hypothetical protein